LYYKIGLELQIKPETIGRK